MSVPIRRALYGKLASDSTLTALLGAPPIGYAQSIYYQVAPPGASFPYVVLSKQAGTPRYAISRKAYDSEVWLVKGVDRDTEDRRSADRAEDVASRLDELLTDGTLSISGRTQLLLRRESDVDYPEVDGDVTYRHSGATFRLITE